MKDMGMDSTPNPPCENGERKKSNVLKEILQSSVFGMSDGATSVIGIILTLTGHTSQIIPTALGLSAASAVGMAAGSYLSQDSRTGLTEAAVIGAATGVGTMLPVLPYSFSSGTPAMAMFLAVLAAIGAMISVARVRFGSYSWKRAVSETYIVLILVCIAVGVCSIATGSSAG